MHHRVREGAAVSILADSAIRAAIDRGDIVIDPMAPWAIGSNSVDLHLSRHLATIECDDHITGTLTTEREQKLHHFDIDDCFELLPGTLYLGSTVEWTSSGPYVPVLEGTSGAARLGISVHCTAGVGDLGFVGAWTLEITVVEPVIVFGGEPIAQLLFHIVQGKVEHPYDKKVGGSGYGANRDPRPQASRMWRKRRWPEPSR
jgi:dCTP deaminase